MLKQLTPYYSLTTTVSRTLVMCVYVDVHVLYVNMYMRGHAHTSYMCNVCIHYVNALSVELLTQGLYNLEATSKADILVKVRNTTL